MTGEAKSDAIDLAVRGKALATRTKAEIEADLDSALDWAETEGRALPSRLPRCREAKPDGPGRK
jgi:hypothetical protein